jgi:hypothetical protein
LIYEEVARLCRSADGRRGLGFFSCDDPTGRDDKIRLVRRLALLQIFGNVYPILHLRLARIRIARVEHRWAESQA